MITTEWKELDSSNERLMEMSLSYSRVSDFNRNGPYSLIQRSNVDNNGVRIGSLVDDLLFEPDSFDEKYHLFNGIKPTATSLKLAEFIIDFYEDIPSVEELIKICKDNVYWKSQKEETLIKNFTNEFYEYIKAQLISNAKTVITTADLALATELKDILISHKYSKEVIVNNLENHNQFYFEIEYDSFKFRGVMDKLVIDHKNKTVKLIDLKTGKNKAEEFQNSFIKWRYYFQEAIYTKAFDFICKKFKLKDYTLLPFEFLYISTSEKIPYLFTVTEKWHKAALNGFKTVQGYNYQGLHSVLDDIKWHLNNKVFDMSRYAYENNGSIIINDDFIEINE